MSDFATNDEIGTLPPTSNVRLAVTFIRQAEEHMMAGMLPEFAACLRLAAEFATDESHAARQAESHV